MSWLLLVSSGRIATNVLGIYAVPKTETLKISINLTNVLKYFPHWTSTQETMGRCMVVVFNFTPTYNISRNGKSIGSSTFDLTSYFNETF
ncbi:MAG: hypothetical protein BWY74_00501 [Firmicutes bacterium ADurb.Bin419]|nr:MAG: hypothetical protein BWY74_00501 [Firmicutes bacterium ADurb.Bin419]